MTILISETLTSALCEQIAHEKYNSNLYLYMCGYLKFKGLDNLAKHFEEQHEEEFKHSKMFFDLLADLNAQIVIPEIDEISIPFNNIKDIAKTYIDREVLTTSSINEIKKLAITEDNPVVEEFARGMLKLQQSEYSEASTFQDRAGLMSEWWQCALWDASIG